MFDRSPKPKVPAAAAARAPDPGASAPRAAEPAGYLAFVPFDLDKVAFGRPGSDGKARSSLAEQARRSMPPALRLDGAPRDRPMQRMVGPAAVKPFSFTPEAVAARRAARAAAPAPSPRPNHVGLPPKLQAGIEAQSRLSMADVRVRYRSPEPARFEALAFARGRDIHLGPGQEHHLPHEAWHVVQQAQGRVKATGNFHAQSFNDDPILEQEADVGGRESTRLPEGPATAPMRPLLQMQSSSIFQMTGSKKRSIPEDEDYNQIKKPKRLGSDFDNEDDPSSENNNLIPEGELDDDKTQTQAEPALQSFQVPNFGVNNTTNLPKPRPNYNHRSDPSLFGPHAPKNKVQPNANHIGNAAAEKILSGKPPLPDEVRVNSNKDDAYPFQLSGLGFHEGYPTSEAKNIKPDQPGRIGEMMGNRLGTWVPMKADGLPATGHSNSFVPNVKKHYNLAHDQLRIYPDIGTEQEKLITHLATTVNTVPTGRDIMESEVLTGAQPVHSGFGKLGLPSTHTDFAKQTDQERKGRADYSREIGARREHFKDRVASLAEHHNMVRPVSPERTLQDEDGTGGEHKHPPHSLRPRSPVPTFNNDSGPTLPHQEFANMSAWPTQTMRWGGTAEHWNTDPNKIYSFKSESEEKGEAKKEDETRKKDDLEEN